MKKFLLSVLSLSFLFGLVIAANDGYGYGSDIVATSLASSGTTTGTLFNPAVAMPSSTYSQEFTEAYQFALTNGITTMKTIEKANMTGQLIRVHMAKMMVRYAIDIIGLTGDKTKVCNFDDILSQSAEMTSYITLACQLGIMGVGMTSFRPDGLVTRAEFGTVLSRILYGNMYNNGTFFYTNHLQALKEQGIIKNDDPTLQEVRGYVMLMLMRANK